jgi:hypothetical protein
MEKCCSKCGIVKNISEFSKCSKSPDKLQYRCRDCEKTNSIEWRLNNPEMALLGVRKWQMNNPDKIKLIDEKYRGTPKQKESQTRFKYKIPAGVYKITQISTNKVLYVGESGTPNKRRTDHFSLVNINKSNNSIIAPLITQGILDRNDLQFEMIHFSNNLKERREAESIAIAYYQPPYNTKS